MEEGILEGKVHKELGSLEEEEEEEKQ